MSTDPRTIKAYDEFASEYDQHVSDGANSFLHEYYEKPAIRAELGSIKGKSILSLGCGSGDDTAWLQSNGAKEVIGVDISKNLIAIARGKYPNVEFEVMDMENLSFDDSKFDMVYSSLALHYVSDWNKLFEQIYRVLKPGGRVVFSCNHPLETAMQAFRGESSYGVHIGRTIDNVTKQRKIYGDYMSTKDNGVRLRTNTFADEHTVYSYHRTFGSMANSIINSGLSIQKVVEPVPLPELQKHSQEHYKQVLKTPKFIIWVLEK